MMRPDAHRRGVGAVPAATARSTASAPREEPRERGQRVAIANCEGCAAGDRMRGRSGAGVAGCRAALSAKSAACARTQLSASASVAPASMRAARTAPSSATSRRARSCARSAARNGRGPETTAPEQEAVAPLEIAVRIVGLRRRPRFPHLRGDLRRVVELEPARPRAAPRSGSPRRAGRAGFEP